MTEKQKKEKKSMNGGFLSVNRLYYSNKQFCSIFKILLFSNGHESNQIENKMPNLVQEYALGVALDRSRSDENRTLRSPTFSSGIL